MIEASNCQTFEYWMKTVVVDEAIEFATLLQRITECMKNTAVVEIKLEKGSNISFSHLIVQELFENIITFFELFISHNTQLITRINCDEILDLSILFLIFSSSITCASKETHFQYNPSFQFPPLDSLLFHSNNKRITPQLKSKLLFWKQRISAQEASTLGLIDCFIPSSTEFNYSLENVEMNHSHYNAALNTFKIECGKYLLQQRSNYSLIIPSANHDIFSNESCVLLDEQLWKEHGIAHLEFNRPQSCNAINMEFTQQVYQIAIFLSSQTHHLKCIILSGKDNHFCSGADVKWLQQIKTQQLTLLELQSLFYTYFSNVSCLKKLFSVPMIAVIHNRLIGGANALAFLCDYIFATENTSLQFGVIKRGFNPAFLLSHTLRQRIGDSLALKMYLEDSIISIQEAHRLGLVQSIKTDYETAKSDAKEFAKHLSTMNVEAMKSSISLLRYEYNEAQVQKESITFAENFYQTTGSHLSKFFTLTTRV